jgi:hypothetical protein
MADISVGVIIFPIDERGYITLRVNSCETKLDVKGAKKIANELDAAVLRAEKLACAKPVQPAAQQFGKVSA